MSTQETWDHWYGAAIAAGVPEHLAALGREVMRDVMQHGLDQSITMGAPDDGPLLIDIMLRAPVSAETRLAGDQLTRHGIGDEALSMVDRAIADRLGVDVEDVEDIRFSERAALERCYRTDAQRRPSDYGPKYRT